MRDQASLRYTETHEWAELNGDICTVGITQFAADQLNDITALAIGKVGKAVTAGKAFGEVETVKAVSDINAPVSGEIVELNAAVTADSNVMKDDPFGNGWLVKIKLATGGSLDHLKTLEQYKAQIASEAH